MDSLKHDYSILSLREVAVSYIRNKIFSGEFKAGDRIVEADIASEIGISRAPVREAMRELNIQGIIEFLPRKSSQILDSSYDKVMEVFDVRLTLEKQIMEILVNENILQEEDYIALISIVEEMMAREKEKLNLSIHEYTYYANSLDIEFHRYLWTKSKSQVRAQILENLFTQLVIFMNEDIYTFGVLTEKAKEHLDIIYALKEGNLEKVNMFVDVHINNYIESVNKNIKGQFKE